MQFRDDHNSVLIIDDVPANLQVLSRILGERSYRVRVATSGLLGLQAARLAPPRLILLDVLMPDLDGYSVCRALRADPQTASIPVLFLSALDATDDKLEAFAAGGADYITKPFQVAEVLARVEVQMARQRAEASLQASQSRLQTIVDNVPAGIALLDRAWQVRQCNRRWAALLGLDPSQVLQMNMLALAHPDDREQRRMRLEALASGTLARYQRETRLTHSDGGFFWADLIITPVVPVQAGGDAFVAMIGEASVATELNPRQREVLMLMAQGRTYKAIGVQLSISERTVRYHVDEILKRLQVQSRAEAIAYISRQG